MNKGILKRITAIIVSASLLSGNVITVRAEELSTPDIAVDELVIGSEESIILDNSDDAVLEVVEDRR